MISSFSLILVFAILSICFCFRSPVIRSPVQITRVNGVRSLTAVLDVLAGISLANQLNSAEINPRFLSNSLNVAVVETKQGLYKEYQVDKVDDSALDEIKRGYKTAEETEEGKNKYWAILAVLVAGSFIIPMVQYYWYVAEEDD